MISLGPDNLTSSATGINLQGDTCFINKDIIRCINEIYLKSIHECLKKIPFKNAVINHTMYSDATLNAVPFAGNTGRILRANTTNVANFKKMVINHQIYAK